MQRLELLAPARTADIGIAAIDCGADAVYIGGPSFGARKDAGNSIEDVGRLCSYAHRFGARVFLTVNTLIYDNERSQVHDMMLKAVGAGVDAFIVQDLQITEWEDIPVPLHASTQCAIRTPEAAARLESLGFSRLVLERELSLEQIRDIASSVKAEIECFVHGALCVCYSGECYLSEYLDGRSANRGECIQACRSDYDLVDGDGKILVRNKALLSLKDIRLIDRIPEMAAAGVCSFKIEGRLKNVSYVKNAVREYSLALDSLISSQPGRYARASFGRIAGGFSPDSGRTFNRGYTTLFSDGVRSRGWSSMDAPKSMGARLGRVISVRNCGVRALEVTVELPAGCTLSNGDGFAFVREDGPVGIRGDVCQGNTIICKRVKGLAEGSVLYRNYDAAFEKALFNAPPHREIPVDVTIRINSDGTLCTIARSEDGRTAKHFTSASLDTARNKERMLAMLRRQISRREGDFVFELKEIAGADGDIPLLSSAFLNGIRRELASILSASPCNKIPLPKGIRSIRDISGRALASDIGRHDGELMRTKYCILYELGKCPVHQGGKRDKPLYLTNNGRRLPLGFDCRHCEMTVNGENHVRAGGTVTGSRK